MKRKLLAVLGIILVLGVLVSGLPVLALGEVAPTITTGAASNETLNVAGITTVTIAANVDTMGSGDNTGVYWWVEYGETLAYGSETTHRKVSKTGAVRALITNFDPDTTYHFRANIAFRDEAGGITHGADDTFSVVSPSVTSVAASDLSIQTDGRVRVRLNGTLDDLGDASITRCYIEYGLTNAYGWKTKEVNKTTIGAFYSPVLIYPGITYHFRAVLRNGANYVYGADTTYNASGTAVSTFTQGSVVIGGADGNATEDAGITYDPATNLLTTTLVGDTITPVTATAIDHLATAADTIILVDATGGDTTITLPTAVGITGKSYTITKTDVSANLAIIDANLAQTINGNLTIELPFQYSTITLTSDGANWIAS